MNQDFINLLDEMKEIHEKKAHDYAKETDPYSNFRESAQTAGTNVETTFFVLIGTKISRLRNLIASGKNAKNESLIDSAKDLTVYCALLTSFLVKEERIAEDLQRNFNNVISSVKNYEVKDDDVPF